MTLTLSRNKSSIPFRESPPSPAGSMMIFPPIQNPDQPLLFPTSPPMTTIITPSVSDGDLLSNAILNSTWLSEQSNYNPYLYPDDSLLALLSPTYDVEVTMEQSRSDPSFSNHLAFSREDEMDLDPAQYPPVDAEDDEVLFELIDFHERDAP